MRKSYGGGRKDPKVKNGLLRAISGDDDAHPERGNATFERIAEILEETMGTEKGKKIGQTLKSYCEAKNGPIKDHRAEITQKQGNAIVVKILQLNKDGHISNSKLTSIVKMLEDSEISSNEAIELHRRHKIPVSRLEEDVIPCEAKESGLLISREGVTWILTVIIALPTSATLILPSQGLCSTKLRN